MRDKYLGDSYDLIKRFWSESLGDIAPLYAHERFVPSKVRAAYTTVTTIPFFKARSEGKFGILLDPHTGIPLPSDTQSEASISHAPLAFVVRINQEFRPDYMICFDMSYHRGHRLNRQEQRREKMTFLRARGLDSFYYVSHAPFLFMSEQTATLEAITDRLTTLGIPAARFER